MSPVFLTSLSVVIVVVPPGVEIFVSVFEVEELPVHPTTPSDMRLTTIVVAIKCFIFNSLS